MRLQKGAILALTREWAVDCAKYGVRVNAVVPAEVYTPQYERWISITPEPDITKASILGLIPLENRFTTADEIANEVVFLASKLSGHTTAQYRFVDGGYTHLDRKIR